MAGPVPGALIKEIRSDWSSYYQKIPRLRDIFADTATICRRKIHSADHDGIISFPLSVWRVVAAHFYHLPFSRYLYRP